MNSFSKAVLATLSVLVLSGCSLGTSQTASNAPSVFNGNRATGSLWRTSDGGHSFEAKSSMGDKGTISSANILSIAYHPQKEKVIYVSSTESGIFKTEDGGEKWTPIAFPPKNIYSFILDKSDPDNKMFASGVVNSWGKIYRTSNGGSDWRDVYSEPGEGTTIKAMAQHPTDINVLFAGTSDGTVIKSVDAGDSWKNVGNKFEGVVSDFAFDAKKKFSAYLLIYSQKLYYSEDGGSNWIDWEKVRQGETMSKGFSGTTDSKDHMPQGIVSITADPNNSGVIYAGTTNGLFRSNDFGKHWNEINIIESAKKFPIRSIAINERDSKELVFVSGRAFYKTKNAGDTWEVTGLNADRDASIVSYDPFDKNVLFIGLRKF